MFDRRETLGLGALALTSLLASEALAQGPAPAVNLADLMTPSPLGDKVSGKADAKVTIIEYASLTCSHCANFYTTTYPKLKEKYIDTGKVKLIFRPFVLNPVDLAANLLVQCMPEAKYFDGVDAFFKQQATWAFTNDPLKALMAMGKQMGFTEEGFNKCLSDQKLVDGFNMMREKASKSYGVDSTPTFFINGSIIKGDVGFEEFEKRIEALLK